MLAILLASLISAPEPTWVRLESYPTARVTKKQLEKYPVVRGPPRPGDYVRQDLFIVGQPVGLEVKAGYSLQKGHSPPAHATVALVGPRRETLGTVKLSVMPQEVVGVALPEDIQVWFVEGHYRWKATAPGNYSFGIYLGDVLLVQKPHASLQIRVESPSDAEDLALLAYLHARDLTAAGRLRDARGALLKVEKKGADCLWVFWDLLGTFEGPDRAENACAELREFVDRCVQGHSSRVESEPRCYGGPTADLERWRGGCDARKR